MQCRKRRMDQSQCTIRCNWAFWCHSATGFKHSSGTQSSEPTKRRTCKEQVSQKKQLDMTACKPEPAQEKPQLVLERKLLSDSFPDKLYLPQRLQRIPETQPPPYVILQKVGNFLHNNMWHHDSWAMLLCLLHTAALEILFKFAPSTIQRKQIPQSAY